jgi:hypothetical protein
MQAHLRDEVGAGVKDRFRGMVVRIALPVSLVAAVACGSRSLGSPDGSAGTGGAASGMAGAQAAGGAGGCGGPHPVCFPSCIEDDFIQPVCTPQGTWACPPGTQPNRSCPRAGTGGSGPVVFDAGGPRDAAVDYTPFDATACDCAIRADGALTMSWDCFVPSYGTGSPELGWCGAPGRWTSGCGLDVFTYDNQGLVELFVYDKQGRQVGAQYQNSDVSFVCPWNPALTSLTVASGSFPASTCTMNLCSCNSDRTLICPASDSGTLD